MKLNKLYDIADKEKINIYNWYIDDCKGMFMNYGNINAIALNYKNIDNSLDEKCTLSEELGHYFMDATYPASCTNTILINKQEYRAKKASYNMLIPFENLKLAILKRI